MTPRIQVIAGLLEGTVFFLEEDDVNIGRGKRNRLRLDDPLVSPRHCSISYQETICMLLDWASANGTFVNEFSFPGKILEHGDQIRVGRTIFVYLLYDEVDERLLKPAVMVRLPFSSSAMPIITRSSRQSPSSPGPARHSSYRTSIGFTFLRLRMQGNRQRYRYSKYSHKVTKNSTGGT